MIFLIYKRRKKNYKIYITFSHQKFRESVSFLKRLFKNIRHYLQKNGEKRYQGINTTIKKLKSEAVKMKFQKLYEDKIVFQEHRRFEDIA